VHIPAILALLAGITPTGLSELFNRGFKRRCRILGIQSDWDIGPSRDSNTITNLRLTEADFALLSEKRRPSRLCS
jgi:hypothetical protein